MISKVDHIVITTQNKEECISFYEKLGFQSKVGNDRYELFAGDFKINVHEKGKELMPHAKEVTLGSGDFCFETNITMEEVCDILGKESLPIEIGIVNRHGVKGEMKSVYLRDPDGNLVEICSYE